MSLAKITTKKTCKKDRPLSRNTIFFKKNVLVSSHAIIYLYPDCPFTSKYYPCQLKLTRGSFNSPPIYNLRHLNAERVSFIWKSASEIFFPSDLLETLATQQPLTERVRQHRCPNPTLTWSSVNTWNERRLLMSENLNLTFARYSHAEECLVVGCPRKIND